MVFPVVMYGCDSWTIKNAERRRIDAFQLWCWRRLLTVPWIARTSSQSILQEISPEYSLEGLMLKLKLQYFGHLMWRADSLEKTWGWEKFQAGSEGDSRGGDGWMASPTQWTWVWASSRNWWWTGKPGVLHSMGSQRVRHGWVTEQNWHIHIYKRAFTHMCACVCTYTKKLLYPLFFFTQIYYKRCSTHWFISPNNLSWWSLFNSRVRLSSFILIAKQYSIHVYLSSLLYIGIDPPTGIFLIKISLQWMIFVCDILYYCQCILKKFPSRLLR